MQLGCGFLGDNVVVVYYCSAFGEPASRAALELFIRNAVKNMKGFEWLRVVSCKYVYLFSSEKLG
jgi:hypothetical protein